MNHRLRNRVVVGADGSPGALRAVTWAADEAARRAVPLRVVTVFPWPDEPYRRDRDERLARFEEHLAAAVRVARERQPALDVDGHLTVDLPFNALHAHGRAAALLVVGSRGLSRAGGLLLGSVAAGLAPRADCPVVVVRGEVPRTGGPVVLGVAESQCDEAAIAFAYEAASLRGARLVAVHTWWDPLLTADASALLVENTSGRHQSRLLAEQLAGWGEKYPDVAVDRVVEWDRPVRQLQARAQGAQLLVVGSRGFGDLRGLVQGSTSHTLLHCAPCPIAVVRSTSEEAS